MVLDRSRDRHAADPEHDRGQADQQEIRPTERVREILRQRRRREGREIDLLSLGRDAGPFHAVPREAVHPLGELLLQLQLFELRDGGGEVRRHLLVPGHLILELGHVHVDAVELALQRTQAGRVEPRRLLRDEHLTLGVDLIE